VFKYLLVSGVFALSFNRQPTISEKEINALIRASVVEPIYAFEVYSAYAASNAVNHPKHALFPSKSTPLSWISEKTGDNYWRVAHLDCAVLQNQTNLMSQPLWLERETEFIDFWPQLRAQLQDRGWLFWIDWYERALKGRPQRWPLLLDIATQEDDFWQGSDSEVMARINEIVERYEASEVESTTLSPDKIPVNAVDPDVVRQFHARIAADHPALTFNAHAVLEQIAQFREKVRSDNQLTVEHPDFRDGLIDFLDRLATSFADLLETLPESTEEVSEEAARDTLSWRARFTAGLAVEFNNYTAPEAMAKAAVPAGLIFSLGGIVALLGGPIGFVAGSYFAKLLVGEVKAGAAADKVEEMMTPDSDADDS
jgi:hypothetical protein